MPSSKAAAPGQVAPDTDFQLKPGEVANIVPAAVARAPGWRAQLKVHPAAELFPLMSQDELRELANDIKKNGLKELVALVFDQETEAYQVLDGRNRLDALALNGVELFSNGKPSFYSSDPIFFASDRIGDPVAYIVSKNVCRRHLAAEKKRELIAKLVVAGPEKSNLQIAKIAHVDDKTVADVRRTLESRSEIPNVGTRTDTKGRKQPARKRSKRNAAKKTESTATAAVTPTGNATETPEASPETRKTEYAQLDAAGKEAGTTVVAETTAAAVVETDKPLKPKLQLPPWAVSYVGRVRTELGYQKRDHAADFPALCAALHDVIDEVAP